MKFPGDTINSQISFYNKMCSTTNTTSIEVPTNNNSNKIPIHKQISSSGLTLPDHPLEIISAAHPAPFIPQSGELDGGGASGVGTGTIEKEMKINYK